MRPRSGWWFPLPLGVADAPTLAHHLRVYAAGGTGTIDDMPSRALEETARLLDGCAATDTACLRAVVRELDARAAVASADWAWGHPRYWESLARAVDRVADALEEADCQRVWDSDH